MLKPPQEVEEDKPPPQTLPVLPGALDKNFKCPRVFTNEVANKVRTACGLPPQGPGERFVSENQPLSETSDMMEIMAHMMTAGLEQAHMAEECWGLMQKTTAAA